MQNKKIVIIVALSIVGFVLVYLVVAGKIFNSKKNNDNSVANKDATKLELPKVKCDFESNQSAYDEANKNSNLDACDCIGDDKMREMCITSTMDIALYSKALENLDDDFCENIKSESHKNSCYSVVKNSIDKLKNENPQRLADIYSRSHNEESIGLYEKLTETDQQNIDNYIYLALAYAEKGLKEQEQGRDQSSYVKKAFEAIEKAKSINGNNSEVYRVEAYTNEIKPDFGMAIKLYDRAIEIDGNNILAYSGRGHANRMMGLLDNAVRDFSRAAELDVKQENVFIYTNLCNLEFSRSHNDDAIKNCKIVTSRDGADPIFQSEAHQIMAMIFMQGGDNNQAKTNILKAKTLTPNDPNLFVTWARLNIFEKKYVESEANARKAIELSPTKASGFLALSYALYMEEKYEASIEAAQKGIILIKNDVSLLAPSKLAMERELTYSIVNNYRMLGDTAKQQEYENKARNIFNNN